VTPLTHATHVTPLTHATHARTHPRTHAQTHTHTHTHTHARAHTHAHTRSPLKILSVRGESSPIADDVYGSFDKLTLTLSHDSDLAGMETESIISQATLLKIFQFNVSLVRCSTKFSVE